MNQSFNFVRDDGRADDQPRPLVLTLDFVKYPEGSVLARAGDSVVLCNVTVEGRVPSFLRDSGEGWLTWEYAMLPRATEERTQREHRRGAPSGRSAEIQRLIGRSLRAALDLGLLGERTLLVDCDVLQADGGTRTLAVTGAFVAVVLALLRLRKERALPGWPVRDQVGAISVGKVSSRLMLDLAYSEDSRAGGRPQPGRHGPPGDRRGAGHRRARVVLARRAGPHAGPRRAGAAAVVRGPGPGARPSHGRGRSRRPGGDGPDMHIG